MRTVLWAVTLLVPAVGWSGGAGEVAERLDALYSQRHDATKAKDHEKAIEDALAAHPEDHGVLWRASRFFYWQCDGTTASGTKKALGTRSAELAQKALEQDGQRIEGHYYAAIGLGCYSQAIGVMTALRQGVEGRFNKWLDKAIALDSSYDNAGPLIAKGRYFFELPWPKRDLKKSASFLQKAIDAKGHALRAHLYLAETQLKDGDAKAAKASVEKALSGEEGYDPAEARRVKAWAKTIQTKVEEELK